MNILDSIMNAGNGAAVRQIGSQVGLDEAQTAAALSALVPALSAGCGRICRRQMGSADSSARCRQATISGMSIIPRSSVMRELSPMATASWVTSSAAKTSAAGLRLRLAHKQASGPT